MSISSMVTAEFNDGGRGGYGREGGGSILKREILVGVVSSVELPFVINCGKQR